jgi:ferredoxin
VNTDDEFILDSEKGIVLRDGGADPLGSLDKEAHMKVKRKIIEIDEERCDGCGQCVPSCAEGAIQIVDGKARLAADRYCDGLGACLGDCPNGALKIVEREAEEFDEEAVEDRLARMDEAAGTKDQEEKTLACGCPSTLIQTFTPAPENQVPTSSAQSGDGVSRLTHWPVQIRLVPATAPFLRKAHLLVAADCTTLACPDFHERFLDGRVVMMGCPKFDDIEEYKKKFTDIFRTADIQSVTIPIMEVPCCSGLPGIVKTAMEAAGADIPLEVVVLGTRGEVLRRERKKAA